MLFFKKKYSLRDIDFFNGFIDCHSHILPGVDDGIQTLDKALQILNIYEKNGVKEVWMTPHIMEEVPNTTEKLRCKFEQFLNSYKGNVLLHLSSENMLDNLFEERLESNDLLPFGEKKNALLVETSYMNPPIGFRKILSKIKSKGFYPILAHPERYLYMNISDYQSLKEDGILFQLNLFSLIGIYGNEVKDKALFLIKNNMYNMTGSDIHSFSALQENMAQKNFSKNLVQRMNELKLKNI